MTQPVRLATGPVVVSTPVSAQLPSSLSSTPYVPQSVGSASLNSCVPFCRSKPIVYAMRLPAVPLTNSCATAVLPASDTAMYSNCW